MVAESVIVYSELAQPVFPCLKSTMKAPEQCVKLVQI